MKGIRHPLVLVAGILLVAQASMSAQGLADSLRKAYRFAEAVEAGRASLEKADSLNRSALEDDLILSQNALSMMDYCSQPVVVAKYEFSLEDFFLYYPMQNRSWRALPNQLDSLGGCPFVRAMYIPDSASDIYYSAPDADGVQNIMHTHLADSLWTYPRTAGSHLTSPSDEIYPMLSRDGKSMYFASKGLYGMGGYDLYVSEWNEEASEWGQPVNMGFPYSSPFDDFLFINSDDGKYSIFASNRGCSRDSVNIYVLEYDSMPVRRKVEGPEELKTLADLEPHGDPSRMNHSQAVSAHAHEEDAGVQRYMEKMRAVRSLRDSLSVMNRDLNTLRSTLSSDEVTDRQALTSEILAGEQAVQAAQARLDKASKELQQVEMDFLISGIVIDPDKLQAEADREVVGTASDYVFSRKEMGPALYLNIAPPPPVPVPELPVIEDPVIEELVIVAD